MKYTVSAPFMVEFIDLDANERGIRTLRQRCAGTVEAIDDAQAVAIVQQRIRQAYPVCWRMQIGPVQVERIAEEPAQRSEGLHED
jgi:hypothetical protein